MKQMVMKKPHRDKAISINQASAKFTSSEA